MADADLLQCLPPGTPTLYSDAHKTWSTVDLVLLSADLEEHILRCCAGDAYGSDHCSLELTLDVSPERNSSPPRPSFRNTDWTKFIELAEAAFATGLLPSTLRTTADIDQAVEFLGTTISRILEESTPPHRPSPFQKRWWTKELTQLRNLARKALRRAQRNRATDEDRAAASAARNKFQSAVRRQKRRHWREFLESITPQDIFRAARYATNTPTRAVGARIPDLSDGTRMATTNQEKGEVLMKTFFPPPPPASLNDTHDFEYPEALPWTPFQVHEIVAAIKGPGAFKAPGPSNIPNAALQHACPLIADFLTLIANASVRLKYFPDAWKCFTTVAIRKPGKEDYSIPKAFRPIALEEAVGKVVESAMASRISALAERHGLLPATHFGGRAGRNTTDALLYLTNRVKDGWRRHRVVSALFLDISQAFPTVSHERLLHNMRKRRLPTEIVEWTRSFLTDRTTILKFADYQSPPLNASNGIPQGSPLSPILYLFYSSDLLEIIDPQNKLEFALGYIDDTALVVQSNSVQENIELLTVLAERALAWERTHACRFDVKKFHLCHFTRNRAKYEPLSLFINGIEIKAEDSVTYLGLEIDRQLRWKQQVENAVAKGTEAALAIGRIARSTFGLAQKHARQLFVSVVVPRMEYGLAVFYEPIVMKANGRRKGSVRVATRFGRVQRLAARIITGAFKTTAQDVLDVHAGFMPVDIRLNRTSFNAMTRLAGLPPSHPLHPIVKRCRRLPQKHRSTIHHMLSAFPSIRDVETITPGLWDPSWKSRCTFSISPDRETAAEEAEAYRSSSFCVFSDGSGIDEGVGGAAVVLRDEPGTRPRDVSRLYLGSAKLHTVYEGELTGAILALELIRRARYVRRATILLDNQGAISNLRDYRPRPGQYLVACFHQELERLMRIRRTLSVHIAWVPGHEGVEGNERADEEAKKAAHGDSSDPAVLPRSLAKFARSSFPSSIAAIKAAAHKKAIGEWRSRWSSSERGARFHDTIDPRPPRPHLASAILDLPRHHASILTQLRTGHVGLNSYLHRIRAVNSPMCVRCRVPETPRHFLLDCKRFLHERRRMRLKVGRLSLPKLLGVKKHRSAVLHYIQSTERFPLYSRFSPDCDD